MTTVKKTIPFLMLICTLTGFGQHLEKHTWKQRVLLVLTETKKHVDYQKQCAEFSGDLQGYTERKLVVYHVTPKAYAMGTRKLQWTASTRLFQKYKKTKTPFEVILIGLDGGVKLRQSKVLSRDDVFAVIDAMPMRSSELKHE